MDSTVGEVSTADCGGGDGAKAPLGQERQSPGLGTPPEESPDSPPSAAGSASTVDVDLATQPSRAVAALPPSGRGAADSLTGTATTNAAVGSDPQGAGGTGGAAASPAPPLLPLPTWQPPTPRQTSSPSPSEAGAHEESRLLCVQAAVVSEQPRPQRGVAPAAGGPSGTGAKSGRLFRSGSLSSFWKAKEWTGVDRMTKPLTEFVAENGTDIDAGLTEAQVTQRLAAQGGVATAPYVPHDEHVDTWSDVCLPCCCITYMGYSRVQSRQETLDLSLVLMFAASAERNEVLVTRGGASVPIAPGHLVEGDVVRLTAGDGVPADVRVVHADGCQVLKYVDGVTWEQAASIDPPLRHGALAPNPWEAENFLFYGNGVLRGTLTAVVTATRNRSVAVSHQGLQTAIPETNYTKEGCDECIHLGCCLCGRTCGIGPEAPRRRLERVGYVGISSGTVSKLAGATSLVWSCDADAVMASQPRTPGHLHDGQHGPSGLDVDVWAKYWERKRVSQQRQLKKAVATCHRWGLQLVVLAEGAHSNCEALARLLTKPGLGAAAVLDGAAVSDETRVWQRTLGVDRTMRSELPCIVVVHPTGHTKGMVTRALHTLGETVCYLAADGEHIHYPGVDLRVDLLSAHDPADAADPSAPETVVLHSVAPDALQAVLRAKRLAGGKPIKDGTAGGTLRPIAAAARTPSALDSGRARSNSYGEAVASAAAAVVVRVDSVRSSARGSVKLPRAAAATAEDGYALAARPSEGSRA